MAKNKYKGDLPDNRKQKDKDKDFSSAEIDLATNFVTKKQAEKTAKKYITRNQYSKSSCFTANMKVLMSDNSYKPIKEVRFGDEVVDADGNINRVIHTMYRKWQGNLYKIKPYGIPEIECTPEHPFLTKDGWKTAKELTINDFLVIPINKAIKDKTDFWWEKDKDFLKVYGLFLAEGNTYIRNKEDLKNDKQMTAYKTTFTFHQDETDLLESVVTTFKKIWNLEPYIGYKKDSLAVNVTFFGKEITNYFRDIAGEGCKNKRIHSKFMLLEPDLQRFIFDGWALGDGHLDSKNRMTAVSISEKLITQMQNICFRCGIFGSIEQRGARENRQTAYNLRVSFNESEKGLRLKKAFGLFETSKIYRKIKTIKIQKPERKYIWGVYNLTIDKSNTFTVNNIAVHNCVPSSMCNALWNTEGQILADEFLYTQRSNKPGEGCYWHDIADKVIAQGICERSLLKEVKTEKEANAVKVTEDQQENAKQYKQKSYIYLKNFWDILKWVNQGYPVVFSIFATGKEWSNSAPYIIDPKLTIEKAPINHAICAIPKTGFQDKQKYGFYITDSAHFGKVSIREISEDFINARLKTAIVFFDLVEEIYVKPNPYKFTRDLTIGDKGEDVLKLQEILQDLGFFPTNIKPTGEFYGITRQAVKDFQKKYEESILWSIGLKLPTGFFGKSSRAKLESLLS
jgi:hypothetical protein